MAEFSEVIRQAQRMCEYRSKRGLRCNDCDAVHICGLELRHVGLDTLCADADAIMAWAAEHPEPVYPTWEEWLVENGVFEPDNVRMNGNYRFYFKGKPVHNIPTEKIFCTIPADIAQQLGIKPKEV